MKRGFLFLPILVALLCSFLFSCNDSNGHKETIVSKTFNDSIIYPGFVHLTDSGFAIDETPFYPIMLNYVVDFRTIDGEFVISPAKYYEELGVYESKSKEETYEQMNAHFELISELGFNTIRICLDRYGKDESGRFVICTEEKNYYLDENEEEILQGFSDMVKAAENNGLRVMLLLKPPFDKTVSNFTTGILTRFSENPAVFRLRFHERTSIF